MSHAKPVDPNNRSEPRVILLATDRSQSIIGEIVDGQAHTLGYSAYGERSAQQKVETRLGFNGQLREEKIGWYLLGNGYRAYNPCLMRFHSPDSWSPFGRGGLNAYMYCVGDPVNASDPTGHSRVGKLFSRGYDFLFGGPGATGSGRPLADFGPMSPEKTGEFTGLMIAGGPVAAAPGPRGDIISEGARMTSVASESLSRPGYADGAALGGLTALGNRSTTPFGRSGDGGWAMGSNSSARGHLPQRSSSFDQPRTLFNGSTPTEPTLVHERLLGGAPPSGPPSAATNNGPAGGAYLPTSPPSSRSSSFDSSGPSDWSSSSSSSSSRSPRPVLVTLIRRSDGSSFNYWVTKK